MKPTTTLFAFALCFSVAAGCAAEDQVVTDGDPAEYIEQLIDADDGKSDHLTDIWAERGDVCTGRVLGDEDCNDTPGIGSLCVDRRTTECLDWGYFSKNRINMWSLTVGEAGCRTDADGEQDCPTRTVRFELLPYYEKYTSNTNEQISSYMIVAEKHPTRKYGWGNTVGTNYDNLFGGVENVITVDLAPGEYRIFASNYLTTRSHKGWVSLDVKCVGGAECEILSAPF